MHWHRWKNDGDPGEAAARTQSRAGICSVDGCDRSIKSKGFCGMHYQRWCAHGDAGQASPLLVLSDGSCSVDGCDRPHHARGWCRTHYRRMMDTGSLDAKAYIKGGTSGECVVDGCSSHARCRNLCGSHYRRFIRTGGITTELISWPSTCSVDGCGKPHRARGYCNIHYNRVLRYSDPLAARMPVWMRCYTCDHPDIDEIESRVIDDGEPPRRVARAFGLPEDGVKRHCDNHINPDWHADRAAWWTAQLNAMQGERKIKEGTA